MESPLTLYRKAIGKTQAQLATDLGVQPPALSKWERKRIPAERVIQIEHVTGIPRQRLRPDLYPPEASAA
jgi:DNA-binding transcriptional regulator YdaS (Cro superfamily)